MKLQIEESPEIDENRKTTKCKRSNQLDDSNEIYPKSTKLSYEFPGEKEDDDDEEPIIKMPGKVKPKNSSQIDEFGSIKSNRFITESTKTSSKSNKENNFSLKSIQELSREQDLRTSQKSSVLTKRNK